mmetsp:Transcript_22320/g.40193  ORF Transcript_22320/g.40193 Transcript_22320/m.40193 type:complete len:306 (+) Transcript_22320:130-1047(+)
MSSPCWLWKAGSAWIDYEAPVAAQIEAAYTRGETVKVVIGGRGYVVDPVAMSQTNEVSGTSRELRRVDPTEAAVLPGILGSPAEGTEIAAAMERSLADMEAARSSLQELEEKVTYVELRITKAAKMNSRMACILLFLALFAFVCFVASLAIGAADSKHCHCEPGGTGYREDNSWSYCAEDEVEVCKLEVAKIMLWSTIAACSFATAVLATLSNPPRFWMLRELQKFRTAVEQAIAAEAQLAALEVQGFSHRGHQVIDACDHRVRVDKWTSAAVRADWRAFLAQGWVTYAEASRIRSVHRSAPRKK